MGTVRSSDLAPGASYVTGLTVTIPNVAPGSYFLVAGTDVNGQIVEGNETNNGSGAGISFPITIQKPDLVPTAISGPLVGSINGSVTVSWTVENQGNGTARATPNWIDRIRLSTDDVYDETDPFLTGISQTVNLAPGASYTESPTVTLPVVAQGNYFLVVGTDVLNQVAESSELNNGNTPTVAFPITIQAADLLPTAVSAPSTVSVGDSVSVSWTIQNQGAGLANPSWIDRIRLSTNATYDEFDTFVTGTVRSSSLAGGASYTETPTVTIPNVPPGSYFLAVGTDVNAQVAEGNEGNNASGAGVSFPITVQVPDLAVTSLSGPSSATSGSSITVSWTIENQGAGLARGELWIDRLRLSTNSVYDESDDVSHWHCASVECGGRRELYERADRDVPRASPRAATSSSSQPMYRGRCTRRVEADNSTGMPIAVTP